MLCHWIWITLNSNRWWIEHYNIDFKINIFDGDFWLYVSTNFSYNLRWMQLDNNYSLPPIIILSRSIISSHQANNPISPEKSYYTTSQYIVSIFTPLTKKLLIKSRLLWIITSSLIIFQKKFKKYRKFQMNF